MLQIFGWLFESFIETLDDIIDLDLFVMYMQDPRLGSFA